MSPLNARNESFVCEMGLGGFHNISYPRGLKLLVGVKG